MKDEFSLENLKQKISSANTAEYFEEVYSSYIHGNYRSAVVMLWSVVILDLIQKLQTLEDAYGDPVATNILNSINDLKNANSKSSAWELDLVKEVCERTDLIDFNEFKTIEYLQQQRHLSAHPVLEQTTRLYVPNKDTARALIRNSLEIILIKPPVYTKKILSSLLTDLDENKAIFASIDQLKKYVKTKYLERMSLESKLKVFETMWKLVMHLDDPDCNKNRGVNLRFISILALEITPSIEDQVRRRPSYYSKLKNESKFTMPLTIFLSRVPSIYKLLESSTQLIINKSIEDSISLQIISYFDKSSLEEHYDSLDALLKAKNQSHSVPHTIWKILLEASDSIEMEERFACTISLYYNESINFDVADNAFGNVLRYVDKFSIKAFEYLLEGAEKNNQTYRRSRANEDYSKIKEKILELEKDFDFSRYSRFNKITAAAEAKPKVEAEVAVEPEEGIA